MKIVSLSGWGQPHDALEEAVPGAMHLPWAAENNAELALLAIARAAENADAVVGWSMGGQMALRAIAAGLFLPRRLVLIATPLRFVRIAEGGVGMPEDTYAQYRDNLHRDPERTFRKSYALIAHGDGNIAQVERFLREMAARIPACDWSYWLDAMAEYHCREEDLSRMPPTLLLHGERDVVVAPDQSFALSRFIPENELYVFPECGHAPHWHAGDEVRELIMEHCA